MKSRGYSAIGLFNPKTPANVGSALRAVGCYGSSMIVISGKRFEHNSTDTMKSWRHTPLLQVDDLRKAIPYDCVPVAVDMIEGAIPLPSYNHPQRAFYIFGPEDGTLGIDVTSWCRDVISIPIPHCMNLAACVNVVLYDRLSKQYRDED